MYIMHFYQYQSFSAEQDAMLRSTASNSCYYENFLTEKEFNFCRNMVMSVKKWPEIGTVSKYWGFGENDIPGKQLKWLLKKIQNLIPHLEVDFFAIQEAIDPWKIHSDIRYQNKKIPYKVILFPMDVEPMSGPVLPEQWPETSTISFHQRNFLSNNENKSKVHGKKGRHGNKQVDWKRPIENPQIEGLVPGYHIKKNIWQKYFCHIPYNFFEGLTIDTINPWKPKSMFYWDNTALHCADNFLSKNIRTKRCLMMFTHYKK